MELTPKSFGNSPPSRRTSTQFNPSDYPTPPHSQPQTDSFSSHSTPGQGLGLLNCGLPTSLAHIDSCPGSPPSLQACRSWSQNSLSDQRSLRSSSDAELFSAMYSSPSGIPSTGPTFDLPILTSTATSTSVLAQSPLCSQSDERSLKTSFSPSYPSRHAPSYNSSDVAFTPRIKEESAREWFARPLGREDNTSKSVISDQEFLSYRQENSGPFIAPQALDRNSRGDPLKMEQYLEQPQGYDESHAQSSSSGESSQATSKSGTSSTTRHRRVRKPRQRTTPEKANHQCHVCGMLFERRFNHRSHMETHNPDRHYPHECPLESCLKKFTRKTDLDRHVESVRSRSPHTLLFTQSYLQVHRKERRFNCELCGKRFARRDTLRR